MRSKSSEMRIMRQRFGQPQQWWAYYLGVTLAQIKMAETSVYHSLPSPAFLKLSKLEVMIQQGTLPVKDPQSALQAPVVLATGTNKKLVNQSNKFRQQAMVAQHKLEVMQIKYQQACNGLAMAALLLKKDNLNSEKDLDTLSLEILQLDAQKQAGQYGPEAQAYVQWKLDCYAYGAERAGELAGQKPAE